MNSHQTDLFINKVIEEFNVPGLAIGIIHNNQIVLSKGYGFRNLEEKLPVTPSTVFPVGSCSKAFTALLCADLANKGLIDLDNPVYKYLPEFDFKDITVRDLLAHRTGIPRNDPIWFYFDFNQQQVLDLVKKIKRSTDPSKVFQYNNFMYAVLGMLIEKVTKQSWDEKISAEILKPLNMYHSNTSVELLKKGSDYATPYAEIDEVNQKLPFRDLYVIAPAGGINSSIDDMIKWVQFQLSEIGPFSNKTLLEMRTPQITINQDATQNINNAYGLGWYISNYQGHNEVWHDGTLDGFYSRLSFFPDEKIGIVILTNSSSEGRYAIQAVKNYILDQLFELPSINWLEKVKTEREKVKRFSRLQNQHLKSISQPNISLDDYLGVYHHNAYGELTISKNGNDLVISYGKELIQISHSAGEVFSGKIFELEVFGVPSKTDFTFKRNKKEEVCEIQIPFESFRGADSIVFTKIK